MYDVEKHAVWIKVAADAMHAELLRQCEALMGADEGTDEAADLERFSKLVAEYEEVRWPIDQTPIQSRPMSPEQRIAKHNLRPYLEVVDPGWADRNQLDYHAAVEAAERVRALVMAEREACAKIADDHLKRIDAEGHCEHGSQCLDHKCNVSIAKAIRNRT